uniref:Uncharacterized protein n=1 Tax=Arundo donax TaxID=35708 RepID=A0A0A9A8N2_ARUDO
MQKQKKKGLLQRHRTFYFKTNRHCDLVLEQDTNQMHNK